MNIKIYRCTTHCPMYYTLYVHIMHHASRLYHNMLITYASRHRRIIKALNTVLLTYSVEQHLFDVLSTLLHSSDSMFLNFCFSAIVERFLKFHQGSSSICRISRFNSIPEFPPSLPKLFLLVETGLTSERKRSKTVAESNGYNDSSKPG